MKVKGFVILLLIISLNNACAMKISFSPAHILLSGEVNENICKEITLSSDKKVVLYGEDRWALKESENKIEDYILSSKQIGLNVSYPGEISLNSDTSFSFCVNAKNSGIYYGTIIYKSGFGVGGIGGIVKVNIEKKNESLPEYLLALNSSLLLAFILLLLVEKLKRKLNVKKSKLI